jgi:ureidoglycolate lyase
MAPSREVSVKPLSGAAFQDFGEVIEDPATHNDTLSFSTIEANQGSARKVLDVTLMNNHYALSQSKKPARPVVNMFVCKPRALEQQEGKGVFPVKILERHPFTPQTFVPMGLDAKDKETAYLVIVAPTLPLSQRARDEGLVPPYPSAPPKKKPSLRERLLGSRPNPFTNDHVPTTTPPITFDLSVSQKPKGASGLEQTAGVHCERRSGCHVWAWNVACADGCAWPEADRVCGLAVCEWGRD